jgi:MFS family permease
MFKTIGTLEMAGGIGYVIGPIVGHILFDKLGYFLCMFFYCLLFTGILLFVWFHIKQGEFEKDHKQEISIWDFF